MTGFQGQWFGLWTAMDVREVSSMSRSNSTVLSLLAKLALALGMAAFGSAALASPRNFDKEHVPGQMIVKFAAGIGTDSAASLLASLGGKSLHSYHASQAQLVEFAAVKKDEALLEAKAEALAKDPRVLYVEANTILHADMTPNDPNFAQLYGLHNDGSNGGKVGADISATAAWDVTTGSRNVLVGIIDTGADYTHPDIAPNYWQNPGETGLDEAGHDRATNGIDDDGNGFIDDWHGWDFANNDNDPMDDNKHGTHVAGTIGGNGNDGVGVVGVNWQVSIVAIKFLTGAGSGTLDDAVKAIEYGTKLGVTLTSNSWGGGGFSDTMLAAIKEAGDHGILFVAAAGNDGVNNDASPHFPSTYDLDNIIAVAATDKNDLMADFSCFGATSVDLGAPGVDILSSVPGGLYDKLSGTSMATPHVSGAAALVKAAYPDATAAQIKARLINTADPIDALAGKTVSGGRLNVASALENDLIAPDAVSALNVADQGTTTVKVQWHAAGDDGDQGLAKRYEVRTSATPIDSEEAWNLATKANVSIAAADGEGEVLATLNGLPFNSSGYLAVKAVDNVGNVGPRSEGLPYSVLQVLKVFENTAEVMDGAHGDAPWGLEAAASGGQVFSDSPGADYAVNLNISLTLDPITLASNQATLVLQMGYDLETGYDFGFIEISKDGGTTWTELAKVTGTAEMGEKTFDLASALGDATTFTLRFRETTDYSINKDGIKIDNVQIYAPMSH